MYHQRGDGGIYSVAICAVVHVRCGWAKGIRGIFHRHGHYNAISALRTAANSPEEVKTLG